MARQNRFSFRRGLLAALASTALITGSGCDDGTEKINLEKNQPAKVQVEAQNSRYKVKLVSKFTDDLAYNGERGIYELTDTETGKVYIGISGIGITERGSHSSGKSTAADER